MTTKRHKPKEIVAKLRQEDVLVSQDRSVADAIRSIGVTEVRCGSRRSQVASVMAERSGNRSTGRCR